jgi:DNA-binding protein Fis
MASHTVQYFGMDTVERAIAAYFMKHGVTEQIRDYLMTLEAEDGDAFFEMVCNYIEKEQG